MINVEDLETAVRLKLDLVVLILNDSGYGMIQWKQKSGGFADFGLKFGNPDFVMLAKSFGATGHLVEKADDLKEMIEDAFLQGGVHLIEVPIDYSENQKVFDIEPKEKACEL